jgi:predicted alpha/beta-fold hydrolase
VVTLVDGDQLVLHDDCPAGWQAGDATALLIHGLGGTHRSPYLVRIAARLNHRNVRTFRLDLRGAGAGAALAKVPYHSGRSDDAAAALLSIAQLCPDSPTVVIGFSLGGNIVLKLLGELGHTSCGNLVGGIAVSPPVELATCCRAIHQRQNRLYDRKFVDELIRQHRQRLQLVPGTPPLPFRRKPKSLLELDDRFTGPINGFGDAVNYYQQCSSARFVAAIRKPTVVLTAADDPLIPVEMFSRLQPSSEVRLYIAPSGGHLGFIVHRKFARQINDPDTRWMDWRVVGWVNEFVGTTPRNGKAACAYQA